MRRQPACTRSLTGVVVGPGRPRPQPARTPFPAAPRAARLPAPIRLTSRSHGERLRLGFRELRRREAGPGGHHGAGESADCRSQRAGAVAEDDGQVLPEVHREAGGLPGQFGAEVHRHVHGPLHGRLEHCVPRLQLAAAAGASQHVSGGAGTVPSGDQKATPTPCFLPHQCSWRL